MTAPLDPITAAALAALGLEAMPETRAGLYEACRSLGIVTEESWSWDRMRAWQHLRAQLPPDPIPDPPPEPKPSAAAEPVIEAPAKPKAKAKAPTAAGPAAARQRRARAAR